MNNANQSIYTFFKFSLLFSACLLGYLLWVILNDDVMLLENGVNNNPVITNSAPPQKDQHVAVDISNYDEIVNRPLFFNDRKPYIYIKPKTPTKKPRTNVAKKIKQFSLNAVIITPEKHLAIIQSGNDKNTQRVALGEAIDDWIIETIKPRSVLLKRGNETRNLELEIKAPNSKQKNPKKTSREPSNKKPVQKPENIPGKPIPKSTTPSI